MMGRKCAPASCDVSDAAIEAALLEADASSALCKAAERVLAHLPKRASDLTHEELVDLVDSIQVYLYSDQNGTKWECGRELSGADVIEVIDLMLGGKGLRVQKEFDGHEVVKL
jgi:triphosphoribosyl-dephospho-CoA synthetase